MGTDGKKSIHTYMCVCVCVCACVCIQQYLEKIKMNGDKNESENN